MYKLYIYVILIIAYFFCINNNIEKFSLNFPENEIKCKCNLDNEIIEEPNNNNLIENFTNYDKSKIKETKKLNRIYNIFKSPYHETAETYYNKNYIYPIKPLSDNNEILPNNEIRYKNIGNSNHKILGNEYQQNKSIGYYNFNLL